MQQGVIPIIGARKLSHVKDNMNCLDLTLSEGHLAKLNDVSKVELGFPHDFLNKESIKSVVYGDMFERIDSHRYSPLKKGR